MRLSAETCPDGPRPTPDSQPSTFRPALTIGDALTHRGQGVGLCTSSPSRTGDAAPRPAASQRSPYRSHCWCSDRHRRCRPRCRSAIPSFAVGAEQATELPGTQCEAPPSEQARKVVGSRSSPRPSRIFIRRSCRNFRPGVREGAAGRFKAAAGRFCRRLRGSHAGPLFSCLSPTEDRAAFASPPADYRDAAAARQYTALSARSLPVSEAVWTRACSASAAPQKRSPAATPKCPRAAGHAGRGSSGQQLGLFLGPL